MLMTFKQTQHIQSISSFYLLLKNNNNNNSRRCQGKLPEDVVDKSYLCLIYNF